MDIRGSSGNSSKIESVLLERAKNLGLHEPDFKYNSPETFTQAVSDCVDYLNFTVHTDKRIPKGLIIAMAGIESGWGTSRFSKEGNNLFGIRTWDPKVPQLKPLDLPDARFGVRTYPTKCQSVQDAIDILNRHPAYADFRAERARQSDWVESWNYELLVPHIAPWSTNEKYSDIVDFTIPPEKRNDEGRGLVVFNASNFLEIAVYGVALLCV